mgnify:CR=1 FL=1
MGGKRRGPLSLHERSDYTFEASLSREETGEMIAHAEEFLAQARRYLSDFR